jgi:hypothetical protein
MRLALEELDAALVLQQPQRRGRHGAVAGEAAGLVEHPRRLFAARADRAAQHQARLEDVASEALAGVRDVLIALAQKGERAIAAALAREVRVRAPGERIEKWDGHAVLPQQTFRLRAAQPAQQRA